MLSILALIAAVFLAVTVHGDTLLWLGLTLLTAGCLPVALAFAGRLTTPRRSAVTLHLGSICAQTGLIVVLIALIP